MRTIRRAGLGIFIAAVASLITANASAAPTVKEPGRPEVVTGAAAKQYGTFLSKGEPATFRLPHGGTIRFRADTDARLLMEPQAIQLLPGKKTSTYSVVLRKGHVDVELPDKSPPKVAVSVVTKSDTRIVTITGKVSLRADGNNVTVVNYHGFATVTQGTQYARLPNNVKRTYLGKTGTVDGEILPAPNWIGGKAVWLALRGTVKVAGYTWTPVTGADSYDLTILDKQQRRIVAQRRTKEPRFETDTIELYPGRYEVKIHAVDRDGFLSAQSRNLDIHVVGIDLPPGAEIQKPETIAIGHNQQISLNHTEGLTLTTADHRVDIQATSAFGLAGLERANILIHPKGGGSPATLTLVRRENLVRAWVGPKTVTWPLEPVELRIDLMDEKGNRLDPKIQPVAKVRVGVTTVDVNWTRDQLSWRAQLPPRTGRGPWIVRLEVVDQYGVLIGRDFVEVMAARVPRKK